jgi:hypothetical protein
MSDTFKAGQVWKYHTREGEENSTVTILQVDAHEKLGNVIHVAITGINISNPRTASGYQNHLPHLPYAEDAVSKSVTELVGEVEELPDYAEGYNNWKAAFDDGKAGVWTLGLKETVQAIDDMMKKQFNG